jgi:hypothetical protein
MIPNISFGNLNALLNNKIKIKEMKWFEIRDISFIMRFYAR